jgi:hypothetical protein
VPADAKGFIMGHWSRTIWCGLLALLWLTGAPATAQADDLYVPPDLVPWVDWVLEKHPEHVCAVVDGKAACIWPGVLSLNLQDSGGKFTLEVTTDRSIAVPIPGAARTWPSDVRVGGAVTVVRRAGGVPVVDLRAGRHQITGRFAWSEVPQTLRVPATVGRIALRLNGKTIGNPKLESGTISLGGTAAASVEERLELDVARRIQDAVPMAIDTRLNIRAAGRPREVRLTNFLVPGTRPIRLKADLPARLEADGTLTLKVRAGQFEVTVEGVLDSPVTELTAPSPTGPWTQTEFWAVETGTEVRAANLSGPPGVDPGRTTLPEAWRSLPAFSVAPGETLRFEEVRRGEPDPAPNKLELDREIWLDATGDGWTVKDKFTGTMRQGWRLEMRDPGKLGHVVASGEDQIITENDSGATGVELRKTGVDMLAESRWLNPGAAVPAVGWSTDVHRLRAQLHLPPGWELLTASGVDTTSGSIASRWSLFDLFFVLIVGMATWRLLGWRWGLIALAGLALSRHESGAPEWIWVALLIPLALERVLAAGRFRMLITATRMCVVATLMLLLALFSIGQIESGLFPSLSEKAGFADIGLMTLAEGGMDRISNVPNAPAPPASARKMRRQDSKPIEQKLDFKRKNYLSLQQDPAAIVSTGPGIPTWSGKTRSLTWSGPVTQDHEMRLWLMGPTENLILSLLRVLLLLALGIRMAGARAWFTGRLGTGGATAVLLAGSILGTPSAMATTPDGTLLTELEQRLTASAPCRPDCVEVPTMDIQADSNNGLLLRMEVHVAAPSGWKLPGPAQTWTPDAVRVNGQESVSLKRAGDGFLHLRLGPGVHRVEVRGRLPSSGLLSLQLGEVPARLTFESRDWEIHGVRADGSPETVIELARIIGAAGAAEGSDSRTDENLSHWLKVERTLDLGLPWRVQTTVQRVGAAASVAVRIPLIPGESVTTEGIEVDQGHAMVTLDRARDKVSWVSNLDEIETLTLTAPTGVPWTEVWTLSCSPMFHCASEGIAPIRHTSDDTWRPVWHPWAGETITLHVTRPGGVPGQVVTIDHAKLHINPGRRLIESKLVMTVRTSQGGQQPVTLPANSQLQSVTIDGKSRPVQALDGVVAVPLKPGKQRVELTWQERREAGTIDSVSAVDLGNPAVNIVIEVDLPDERWLLWVDGPSWGPVVLFWKWILLLLIAAPLLARLPYSPLGTGTWIVLGLGMAHLPPPVAGCVALWFVAVGFRARQRLGTWWSFNLFQLALLGWTLVAAGCLYAAIHTGLLLRPDIQVEGFQSTNGLLRWFVDRSDGALPQPTIISLPMWTWRVAMLAWALWLAAKMVRWVPWAWASWSSGGMLEPPPSSRRVVVPEE